MRIALVSCAILCLSSCGRTSGRAPTPEPSPAVVTDRDSARSVVIELGKRLSRVSLLAPRDRVVASIRAQYDSLVAPELLDEWVRDPESAPGRLTSSPWPDRIEIDSMTAGSAGRWNVAGAVVEVTSTGPTDRIPVRMELVRRDDHWLVSAYELEVRDETKDDSAAAISILRAYYRAIDERRYPDAYRLWASGGSASHQSLEEFARGFSSTAAVDARIGTPGPIGAAAGSRYVEVPVRVLARLRDGTRQEFTGTYTLRRSVVDGATADQRAWRIDRASMHRVGP